MMLICNLLVFVLTAAPVVDPAACPYPNELTGFKVCGEAPWRALHPLVSTSADVRRVLGTPSDESDIARYGKPYPGDDRALAPVLTFDGGPDWEILVYFVKSDARARESLSESVSDRLLSIDLLPKHPRSFAQVVFPSSFQK